MSTAGEERMTHREDELAILDTLHRYAHTIDGGPAEDWLDCFTDDGVWATRRDGQAAAGFPSAGSRAAPRWRSCSAASSTL